MQLNLTSELLMDNQNHRNCLTPKLCIEQGRVSVVLREAYIN